MKFLKIFLFGHELGRRNAEKRLEKKRNYISQSAANDPKFFSPKWWEIGRKHLMALLSERNLI